MQPLIFILGVRSVACHIFGQTLNFSILKSGVFREVSVHLYCPYRLSSPQERGCRSRRR